MPELISPIPLCEERFPLSGLLGQELCTIRLWLRCASGCMPGANGAAWCCVCVCVCLSERESEQERKRGREGERERGREGETERESERKREKDTHTQQERERERERERAREGCMPGANGAAWCWSGGHN